MEHGQLPQHPPEHRHESACGTPQVTVTTRPRNNNLQPTLMERLARSTGRHVYRTPGGNTVAHALTLAVLAVVAQVALGTIIGRLLKRRSQQQLSSEGLETCSSASHSTDSASPSWPCTSSASSSNPNPLLHKEFHVEHNDNFTCITDRDGHKWYPSATQPGTFQCEISARDMPLDIIMIAALFGISSVTSD